MEDQQKINRFARHNAKWEELRDDLKNKKVIACLSSKFVYLIEVNMFSAASCGLNVMFDVNSHVILALSQEFNELLDAFLMCVAIFPE